MFSLYRSLVRCVLPLLAILVLSCAGLLAEPVAGGSLTGKVTDETAAVIPGATVTLSGAGGLQKTTSTNEQGVYTFAGLEPGVYEVRAVSTGFASSEEKVDFSSSMHQTLNIELELATSKQEVTVEEHKPGEVSVEPENNASALIIKGKDLDSLSDDPDELESDLQALAGPSAGPNGGQIFIDGFSGGRLPPKQSIREVRINQNPFAAEYDRLGFGRIEVFTKPGTDKFRGEAFFNYGNDALNSRNPYAPNKAPFTAKMFGGDFSGPVNKKASFFLDLERRALDDNALINATILDPTSLQPQPYSEAVVTPLNRTTIGPRLDYQLNDKNTLVGRYHFTKISQDNAGVGQFALQSRSYDSATQEHNLQLTETAILSAKAVNETRLQFMRSTLGQDALNSEPALDVLESFQDGGSTIGHSLNRQDRWELQNYTSLSLGRHSVKVGARLRTGKVTDISPQNFAGTFTFAGAVGPELDANNQPVLDSSGKPILVNLTSIERYQRTLQFQSMGLPANQIRLLGGGASQFSIAAGNPLADVRQTDVGAFVQDDLRLRSNFTLSMGLRYETQTNIGDWRDFSPRIGFAWSPDSTGGRTGKTVVRGGFGIFYDRVDDTLTLQSLRFNGITQQQYVVINPDFFPAVPSADTLGANAAPANTYELSSDMRAPYILQAAAGIERRLPFNTTVASTYTFSRGVNLLRTRNIGAPLPDSGIRPFGDQNIYLYESTGFLRQHQLITNINTRFNKRVMLFGFYVLGKAYSDTEGVNTLPANQYDLHPEWGRSTLDVRHRGGMGGSITLPLNLRLSPFIIIRSGVPFNITTGRDINRDTVFTERPAFATDLNKQGVVVTPFGAFDPNPGPGETIIPRDYGDGPGYFSLNLRLARTFGFGPKTEATSGGGGPMGGIMMGGQPRGGPRGGGGGGMRGFDAATGHRYNLTLGISARNVFNRNNPGTPVGNLTSPSFGESLSTASFGPDRSAAGNRRVDLSIRFSF